jgi:uncharacterized membrane protein YdfJ with MMPL/SSD domain
VVDPLVQQIGVGGAVAVALVATVLKFLPAFMAALKRNNGNNKSAGLTASEWKTEIRSAVKDVLKETAAERHQELEKLTQKVLRQEFLGPEFRRMMQDILRPQQRDRDGT